MKDPARAPAMAAYMKTSQPFYGVAAPRVQAIARAARKRFHPANRAAYEKNVLALWRQPQREARYAAIEYAKQPAFLTPDSIPLFERMIREGAWWDFVDGIASNLAGLTLLAHRKEAQPVLKRWIKDPDLWIRRAALLAHLRHKRETNAALLFEHCLKCASEKAFFIRKAMGWALREYSKSDPDAVQAFLQKNRGVLSKLSLREGARRLVRAGKLPHGFPGL